MLNALTLRGRRITTHTHTQTQETDREDDIGVVCTADVDKVD